MTEAVYTDGCARPNPGPGGWAVVWVRDDRVYRQWYGHEEERTTNNRMELRALIEAFTRLPPDAKTTVYSDSMLAVKTVTEWAPAWERRGWRRKWGTISNLDLVKRLVELSKQHPGCSVQWLRGHDGNRWNEHADKLANLW